MRNTIQPVDMDYLLNENKIFWLNEQQEFFMSSIYGSNVTKIFTINGKGSSMSVDWVERCIYYVQSDPTELRSSIYKLDLNKVDKGVVKTELVLTIPNLIVSIKVSPFTR